MDICASLAPYASLVLFLAPFPTIQQIRRDKGVGTLPLLPYTFLTASAFIWSVYGLLKKEAKVWSANAVGLVLGVYYMTSFISFCPKASPTLPGSVKQHLQGLGALIVATLLVAFSPLKSSANVVGLAAVMLTIGMFASPLSALKVVLQTKSAKSIPLPFTLASMVNCFLWSVTGIFQMKDPNIIVPNVLGLAFSLAQAGLKLLYGNAPELPM